MGAPGDACILESVAVQSERWICDEGCDVNDEFVFDAYGAEVEAEVVVVSVESGAVQTGLSGDRAPGSRTTPRVPRLVA